MSCLTALADMCCFHGNEWSDHHCTRCTSSLYMIELMSTYPDTCTHTRAIRFIWHISLFSMLSEPLHVFVLLLDSPYIKGLSVRLRGERSLKQRFIPPGPSSCSGLEGRGLCSDS